LQIFGEGRLTFFRPVRKSYWNQRLGRFSAQPQRYNFIEISRPQQRRGTRSVRG
jgi:hypothetical protein